MGVCRVYCIDRMLYEDVNLTAKNKTLQSWTPQADQAIQIDRGVGCGVTHRILRPLWVHTNHTRTELGTKHTRQLSKHDGGHSKDMKAYISKVAWVNKWLASQYKHAHESIPQRGPGDQ